MASYRNTFSTTCKYKYILYKTIRVFECIVSFFENGNLNENVIVGVVVNV